MKFIVTKLKTKSTYSNNLWLKKYIAHHVRFVCIFIMSNFVNDTGSKTLVIGSFSDKSLVVMVFDSSVLHLVLASVKYEFFALTFRCLT